MKSICHFDYNASKVTHKNLPQPLQLSAYGKKCLDYLFKTQLDDGLFEKWDGSDESRPIFCSPAFLAPRKNSVIGRIVVDYRKCNEALCPVALPSPNQEKIFHNLKGKKMYFGSDLSLAYNLAKLDTQTRRLLSVVTHSGVYLPTRLTLGPSPAPGWFQAQTEAAFGDIAEVFIDDIGFGEDDLDVFIERMEKVFRACESSGARLSLTKTFIGDNKIEVLGHIVDAEGMHPNPSKLFQIKNWPVPTNREDLVSFVHVVRYLQCYTSELQNVAAPLKAYELKEKPFSEFSSDAEALAAFEALKTVVSDKAVLTRPDYDAANTWQRPFEVFTDASQHRYAWAICQRNACGHLRVWKCATHTFDKTQKQWSTLERELYAIVDFIKAGYDLVKGSKWILYTDHQNLGTKELNSLASNRTTGGKLLRWFYLISRPLSTGKRVYLKGEANIIADALSRMKDKNDTDIEEIDDLAFMLPRIRSMIQFIFSNPDQLDQMMEAKKKVLEVDNFLPPIHPSEEMVDPADHLPCALASDLPIGGDIGAADVNFVNASLWSSFTSTMGEPEAPTIFVEPSVKLEGLDYKTRLAEFQEKYPEHWYFEHKASEELLDKEYQEMLEGKHWYFKKHPEVLEKFSENNEERQQATRRWKRLLRLKFRKEMLEVPTAVNSAEVPFSEEDEEVWREHLENERLHRAWSAEEELERQRMRDWNERVQVRYQKKFDNMLDFLYFPNPKSGMMGPSDPDSEFWCQPVDEYCNMSEYNQPEYRVRSKCGDANCTKPHVVDLSSCNFCNVMQDGAGFHVFSETLGTTPVCNPCNAGGLLDEEDDLLGDDESSPAEAAGASGDNVAVAPVEVPTEAAGKPVHALVLSPSGRMLVRDWESSEEDPGIQFKLPGGTLEPGESVEAALTRILPKEVDGVPSLITQLASCPTLYHEGQYYVLLRTVVSQDLGWKQGAYDAALNPRSIKYEDFRTALPTRKLKIMIDRLREQLTPVSVTERYRGIFLPRRMYRKRDGDANAKSYKGDCIAISGSQNGKTSIDMEWVQLKKHSNSFKEAYDYAWDRMKWHLTEAETAAARRAGEPMQNGQSCKHKEFFHVFQKPERSNKVEKVITDLFTISASWDPQACFLDSPPCDHFTEIKRCYIGRVQATLCQCKCGKGIHSGDESPDLTNFTDKVSPTVVSAAVRSKFLARTDWRVAFRDLYPTIPVMDSEGSVEEVDSAPDDCELSILDAGGEVLRVVLWDPQNLNSFQHGPPGAFHASFSDDKRHLKVKKGWSAKVFRFPYCGEDLVLPALVSLQGAGVRTRLSEDQQKCKEFGPIYHACFARDKGRDMTQIELDVARKYNDTAKGRAAASRCMSHWLDIDTNLLMTRHNGTAVVCIPSGGAQMSTVTGKETSWRKYYLLLAHNSLLGTGHGGPTLTYNHLMDRGVFWGTMWRDVQAHCKACISCTIAQVTNTRNKAPLGHETYC